jgi:hypothetical protein
LEKAAAVAPSSSDGAEPETGNELTDAEAEIRPRSSLSFPSDLTRLGDDVARLCSARLLADDFDDLETIDRNETISIEMRFEVLKAGYVLMPNFHVFLQDRYVFVSSPPQISELAPGIYNSTMSIPRGFLNVGFFVIGVALTSINPQKVHFYVQDALRFHVAEQPVSDVFKGIPGPVRPSMGWNVTRA